MTGNLPEIRKQLGYLAASKKTRFVPNTQSMPCKWHPLTVTCPESGELFTEAGAWEFIISLLETGVAIEEIVLRKPPGKTGYVLQFTPQGGQRIYIKLQLGAGTVIGRSFHYSRPGSSEDE
ncbi:hypothetical protein ACQKGO_08530 [Corallococcus interemptor]|uniref:hypothetical protein n=1 Tax=Corallococcus interemptor TaxID=2316720 RepID=UPI003D060A4D